VAFDQIASLSTAPNGADVVLALTARDGERYVLVPERTAAGAGRGPDQKGLAAFAERLRAAMIAAGTAAPPVSDGLGFWSRGAGLAVLGIGFAASVAVAAVVLWGLWQGAASRVKTHEAAAAVVVLPIFLGGLLGRCWQRRRAVLRTLR
jgi:hypothetical protein